MLYKIHSHAQIQALQAHRSDEHMHVKLVSLESVRIARESYALLCPLIMESRSWGCPKLDSLSVVAALSLEIQKLEHDVLPQLMVQEAKLERGALEALLVMQNSEIKLLHLAKCYKEAFGVLLDEEHLLSVSAQVEALSTVLQDTAVRVLKGCNNVWLQARLPWLVQLVTYVLEMPVRFHDSDE